MTAVNINKTLLKKLTTDMFNYESADSVVDVEDTIHSSVEFLHTLNPPGIPPYVLYLKLCNGTRLQVETLHKHVIEATIFTEVGQGETVFSPRIPLIPSDYFQVTRLQFPVKVGYAMTINKAQGQRVKVAGVDLRSDCFSHGQVYVACSRVISSGSLAILHPGGKTKNVVYKEVLQN